MDCLDVQRGTCIILFLIVGARNIGTPINLSTPRLHDVWFYSCCFSKHTHRCSAGFSLCCNTGHPSHVLILFHKYHPVASALSDFILTSFPVSQTLKAPSLCLLLLLPPPFTTCFHSTQPVWRCRENPPSHTHIQYLQHVPGTSIVVCFVCAFIKAQKHTGKNESAMFAATRIISALALLMLLLPQTDSKRELGCKTLQRQHI